jgi:hypothetical protein
MSQLLRQSGIVSVMRLHQQSNASLLKHGKTGVSCVFGNLFCSWCAAIFSVHVNLWYETLTKDDHDTQPARDESGGARKRRSDKAACTRARRSYRDNAVRPVCFWKMMRCLRMSPREPCNTCPNICPLRLKHSHFHLLTGSRTPGDQPAFRREI